MKGTLFIVSGPSGAGKSSLVKAALEKTQNLTLSISYTTRARRPGEIDGVHYHFVDKQQFEQMVAKEEFLEHAKVFDNYYGTSYQWTQKQLSNGENILLEIDWQGAEQVKQRIPSTTVIVLPPSVPALRERLTNRGQDDEAIIKRRMRDALSEISHYPEYDYAIINDDFDAAVADLITIVRSKNLETRAQLDDIQRRFDQQ